MTSIYPGRVATEMQRKVRRCEGGPFEADRYLAAESVAAAVQSVLAVPPDAHLTEFVLEPTRLRRTGEAGPPGHGTGDRPA